jgi:hypothetical protein
VPIHHGRSNSTLFVAAARKAGIAVRRLAIGESLML